ncbi:MAG: prephenate dehydrogenase/arogenate dehydrogenase family protein [Candidatus Bathyarchaeia archaeon]|nr:prephenate dehydrogenase/arogenate dehydrogenase family protein [Candidatus Bathyarchaeota archaeon]
MYDDQGSRIVSKGKVAVIGGTGLIGRALARLLKRLHYEVHICSRTLVKARRIAGILNVEAVEFESIPAMDIVVVSVPVEATVPVSMKAIPLMRSGSLLVDVAAVKTPIVEAISKNLPEDLEYLSLHPLFGPLVRRYAGENLIAIKAKPGPLSERLLDDLRVGGLHISTVSPMEHDRLMAAYQALHHYSLLSLALALNRHLESQSLELNPKFYTKSFKLTLKSLGRMRRNLESIMEIQRLNPEAAAARKTLLQSILETLEFDGESEEKMRGALKLLG